MSSLKTRLAGRAPRRVSVPIEVSDPGEDVRTRAVLARQALAIVRAQHAAGLLDDESMHAAQDDADQAAAALAEHCLDVVLIPAPPAVWEAIQAEHVSDDGADLDAAALPAMLAASAEDPDLRDADWWIEQLHVWPFGDREALRAAVLDVNAWTPGRALGKG